MEASARIFGEMVAAGADIVEAQLPFSDPSADGGSIVEANHAALRAGPEHGGLPWPSSNPCAPGPRRRYSS